MAIGTLLLNLGIIAGPIVAQVINVAVGLGLSFIARRMYARDASSQTPAGTNVTLRSGGVVPCSFIHGVWATAGSLGYSGTWGEVDNTPNAYMVARIDLSDLPLEDLVGLVIDGEAYEWNTGAAGDSKGIAVPGYNNKLWVKFYRGTQTTADNYLMNKFSGRSFAPYTSKMIGTGCAYAIVTALVDEELFPNGFPEMMFVLEGTPLYDVRNDTTAGGSGTETWGDVEDNDDITENPMVVAYNILRGITYNGNWFYGGQTLSAGQLPFDEWAAAMNECDAPVPHPAGGTEPQFRCGGEISLDQEPAELIEELLTACNGRLAEAGGIYKPRVGAVGAAVFTFSDADVLVEEGTSLDPFKGLDVSINGVAGQYIEPEAAWDWRDTKRLNSATYEAEDGGRRLMVDVQYGRVKWGTQAQRLNHGALAEARHERSHVVPLPPEANQCEPLDVVAFTSEINGYTNKLFSVERTARRPDMTVELVIIEVDPSDYDPPAGLVVVPTNPPVIVRPAAQSMLDWDAEPVKVLGADGRQRPGIKLFWDPSVTDVDGVQYEVRLQSDDTLVWAGETDRWDLGSLITTANLLPLTNYKVRGRYRPASARQTSWSGYVNVLTDAIITVYEDLSDTLQASIQRIMQNFPAQLATLRADLDQVSQAVADTGGALTEQGGWTRQALGARYEQNKAGIEEVRNVAVGVDSALAQIMVDLFAITDTGEASVLARWVAASAPEGSLARMVWEMRAGGADAEFAESSFEMIALYDAILSKYISMIRMKANRLEFEVNGAVLDGYLLTVADTPFPVVLTAGTPNKVIVDLANRRLYYKVTLTASAQLEFPTSARAGWEWRLIVEQDATGGRALTVSTDYISAPTISTGAHDITVLQCGVLFTNPPTAFAKEITGGNIGGSPSDGHDELTVPGTYEYFVPPCTSFRIRGWSGGGAGGDAGIRSTNIGGTGGTTTVVFEGGVQTTLQALGGRGGEGVRRGSNPPAGGSGQAASGGTTNTAGDNGHNGQETSGVPSANAGRGGDAPGGGGSGALRPSSGDKNGLPGEAPGGGGGGAWNTFGGNNVGGGGASGSFFDRTYTTLAVGLKLTVTIGDGGVPAKTGKRTGGYGAAGAVWFDYS